MDGWMDITYAVKQTDRQTALIQTGRRSVRQTQIEKEKERERKYRNRADDETAVKCMLHVESEDREQ